MFDQQTSESVLWHPSTVASQSDQTADSGQWTALGLCHLPLGLSVANPVFKIKKPSQNVRKNGKVMQGNARGFSCKKFAIFFPAIFSKYRPNPAKTPQKMLPKCTKNDAIFDVFLLVPNCQRKSKVLRPSSLFPYAFFIHLTQHATRNTRGFRNPPPAVPEPPGEGRSAFHIPATFPLPPPDSTLNWLPQ